jgi:uncharacterized protein (DUF58 family)
MFHALRQWALRHVTTAGALLFWAMLAAGSFTDAAQGMAHYLFALIFCALVSALIWVRRPRHAIELERAVPRQASVGAPFSYRIRIRNMSERWQRGLELWEGVPDPRPTLQQFITLEEPGEARRNWFDRRYRFYRWMWLCHRNSRAQLLPQVLPDLPPRGETMLHLDLTPLRRGRLTLAGAEVARTDPFGLFRRLAPVREQPASILVYPRRFRLPPIPLPGHSQQLHSGGVALAGSVGESEEFVSVRDYRPGDPFRRIHWAGWARTQRPVVKEFQEEFFVRHALLLDTFAGGPQADAFEEAVSLAASFASTVDQRDTLLDLMFVGDRAYVFTAGRGVAHGEQLLEILAGVDLHPGGDPAGLEPLVFRHIGRLSGCILILLAWDAPRRRLWQMLEARDMPNLTFVVHAEPRPAGSDIPEGVHWLQAGRVEAQLQNVAPT